MSRLLRLDVSHVIEVFLGIHLEVWMIYIYIYTYLYMDAYIGTQTDIVNFTV